MKPTFHHRPVNGLLGDPAVFVRLIRERRALLFDLGDLGSLAQSDLLKITDVFVSHMHMDHFVGFDALLRATLRRETPLRVHGPSDIVKCVAGKLRGYTWNLIAEYPLEIEVFGIGGGEVRHVSFHARDGLRGVERGSAPFSGVLLAESGLRVRACEFSHGIPCMGYVLEEDRHLNVDKDALERRGLPVGPWLGELKLVIAEGREDADIEVGGETYRLADLRDLVHATEGQSLGFVTDIAPSKENIVRLREFVAGVHTLYCETYYLDSEVERAHARHHLTGRIAGATAREAGVRTLVPMHISPLYASAEFTPAREAIEAFGA
jgi:ribonuclease Z